MDPRHPQARLHRKAMRQSAFWLHARAKEVRQGAASDARTQSREASLRAMARLCERSASTMDCRSAKDAMLAEPMPEGMDPSGWNEGVCGGLNGVNLHAARLGVSPWARVPDAEEVAVASGDRD